MKVFLDTNVLVSAFATRGLSADVFRYLLAQHELLVGEVVLDELARILEKKLKVPQDAIAGILTLLRDQTIVPRPDAPSVLEVHDPDDRWVLASALTGGAEVLVTGDRDLLECADQAPLPILTPREFWDRVRGPQTS